MHCETSKSSMKALQDKQIFLKAVSNQHSVFVRWGESGEAADGRQSVPLRSSGTFATANGGFAALLMGSSGVGAGGCVLGFRAVRCEKQIKV